MSAGVCTTVAACIPVHLGDAEHGFVVVITGGVPTVIVHPHAIMDPHGLNRWRVGVHSAVQAGTAALPDETVTRVHSQHGGI